MKFKLFWFIIPLILICPFISVLIAGQREAPFWEPMDSFDATGFSFIYAIWGSLTAILLLVMAIPYLTKTRTTSIDTVVEQLYPFFMGVAVVNLVCYFSSIRWDYNCFKACSQAFIEGQNPYALDAWPLPLPPTLVYFFKAMHSIAITLLVFARPENVNKGSAWDVVFFFVQVFQGFTLWAMAILTWRYAKMLRFSAITAIALSCLLIIGNSPVLQAFKYSQPLFFVLATILAGVLLTEKYPFVGGVLAGLGSLLKVFPVVLLWPWLLNRKWSAVLGLIITIGVLLLWDETHNRWILWEEWYHFVTNFPNLRDGFHDFRNNNIQGVIFNVMKFAKLPGTWVHTVQIMARGVIVLWFGLRALKRGKQEWLGHVTDALAFPFFMSPDLWEHAYTFAIPIWLFWVSKRKNNILMAVLFLMIFGLPPINIFPLGYSRIAGVFIGMLVSEPKWPYGKLLKGNPDNDEGIPVSIEETEKMKKPPV